MFTVYIWLVILVDIPTLSSGCSAKQIYEQLFLEKSQRASAIAAMRRRDAAPAYLIVVSFGDTKGRGVVADRDFQPGDFITYYHGKFFTQKPDGANSAYLFEVNDSGESTWIDASDEDGSYGRLINDDWRSPTAAYEVLRVDGQPRVAFFATKDIQRGEEITYNYGEDMSLPWRKQTLVTEAIRCLVIAPEYLLLADFGPPKGRGIIADKDFKEGEFITFYDGKPISEDIPHGGPYPFKHTPNEWIDASEVDGSYGRLLNDEWKHPNARPEVADVDRQHYIAFYASRPIQRGEEITFSYNNNIGFPWRKKDAEEAIRELDISPEHLRVVDFGFPKGRGVVTDVDIEQDGFITFFHGNCVTEDPRNATYSLKIDANDKHIWIDATKEDGSYGRLINDDWRQPNARTETVTIDEETHVIFLANRPIERGEEIMYSYNASSELPWRIKTPWEEAEDAIRSADAAPSSLLVVDFGHPKGRGVVAARDFKEGDYLTYYHGHHSLEEPSNDDKTYRFRIIKDGNTSWTDAFMEDGSYGRLINDEWRAALSNAAKTIIVVDGQQLVAFFASRAIPRGEELLYSYNDGMEFPWRKTEVVEAVRRSDSAPDYLAVVDFGQPKGKGIVAGKNFETDDFITFYAGERVFDESAVVNATHLHHIQQDDGDIWIDASKDDGSYGRLLNDDWRKPNARPESVTVDGVLHIAFFANRPIHQGDEIMFSYGSSMDSPWRKKEAEVAIRSKDIAPSYLIIVDFGQVKGRGVVAAKDFASGDFIAYLIGQRLSELAPDTDKSFLIEIETGGRFVLVDFSCDKVSSGRLINDDWVNPNADMYAIHVDGEMYITFFAIRDIQRGDEITYDYRSDNYWRKQDGLKEVDWTATEACRKIKSRTRKYNKAVRQVRGQEENQCVKEQCQNS
ncbi:uncharacterized protein LOC124143059 [Haliotis rufescens]|uniref:uncharacterized protein LOC124143059 n=1 Tax=Haliotis rufescens TaxID=6454 RepID=UPI00201E8C43|nr:uncharacterized protein LOC124143059 [Haliotis rufescens]